MNRYFREEAGLTDYYYKIENGRAYVWLRGGEDSPMWEPLDAVPSDFGRPWFVGDERGFISRIRAEDAAIEEQISRSAF